MDGAMDPTWVQCLPELLGKSKSLTLGSGEHLFMSEGNTKLIFETGDLDNASPACLLNCVSKRDQSLSRRLIKGNLDLCKIATGQFFKN